MPADEMTADQHPDAGDVERIVRDVLGESVATVRRIPTGLEHYVFDVVTAGGRTIVVRLTHPTNGAAFAGSVYWHARLRPLNAGQRRRIAEQVVEIQRRHDDEERDRGRGSGERHRRCRLRVLW